MECHLTCRITRIRSLRISSIINTRKSKVKNSMSTVVQSSTIMSKNKKFLTPSEIENLDYQKNYLNRRISNKTKGNKNKLKRRMPHLTLKQKPKSKKLIMMIFSKLTSKNTKKAILVQILQKKCMTTKFFLYILAICKST